MKKIIRFSKLFVILTITSAVIIVTGLVMTFTRGINYGIDFKPGLIQEISITPPVLSVTYNGSATVSVQISTQAVSLVVSGVGADNATYVYPYGQYVTAADMAAALNKVEGISAKALVGDAEMHGVYADSAVSNVITLEPYNLYNASSGSVIPVDEVRSVLEKAIPEVAVKGVGSPDEKRFQIRVGDDGKDSAANEKITAIVTSALADAFGAGNIAVIKTDFIGARFSESLARQSAILVALTLGLILLYCTFRFKWDFAFGAVLAIIHDALIMLAFIVFTQMEFTSITIAAILTIVGYSINDTIVVLDRVRENMANPNVKVTRFTEILDISQTEILSRTIITTLTTMLAVISLYVFTTGQMKDFALALLVGMVSGVYSTIFITGAFIALVRRKWKPSDEEKHASGTLKVSV